MDRRKFIKGMVATPALAALPAVTVGTEPEFVDVGIHHYAGSYTPPAPPMNFKPSFVMVKKLDGEWETYGPPKT